MLTICTFKWGSKYGLDHVHRLRNMLARNLTIPWRFVLITDDYHGDPGQDPVETEVVRLWEWGADLKLCGRRIYAFAPEMRELLGERFAWVDLDVVITANVDHIFGRMEKFVALSTPQGPLAYNGSLVMMDAGARGHVWADFTGAAYGRLPAYYAERGMMAGGESDEGWMTLKLGPGEARINGAWGRRDDGVYFFRHDLARGKKLLPADARMVILNGHANDPSFPAINALPWVRQHWR